MSLESNIAALVAASTGLTQAVNITKATVEATRDSAIAKEAPVTTAKDAVLASTATATTDASTTGTKLVAAAADYATQKTTKGLAAVQTSADTELKDRLHRRDPARHPFRGARPSLVMDFVRRECHRNNAAGNLEPVDLNTFMTFTRGSTATYVGPDGLIKEAAVNTPRYGYDPVTGEALGLLIEEQRTNLVTYSRNLESGSWARTGYSCETSSDCLAPDGSLSASKLVALTSAWLQCPRQVTVTPNTTYTFSFWINLSLSTRNGGYRVHDISNSVDIGSYLPYVGSNGWVRQTFTFTTASNCTAVNIYPHAYDALAGYKFYFWGIQLEAGSFPTSYIPTPATFTGRASTKTYFDSNGVMQTAASGVAATDYGYVDGRWVSKGLSLEGQATNLLTSLANQTPTNATKVTNAAIAPDGTTTAFKLIPSTTLSAAHYTAINPSVASGNTYACSVFAAAAEYSALTVVLTSGGFGIDMFGTFNLATGVCGVTTASYNAGARVSMQKCGAFWRCVITAPCVTTNAGVNIQFRPLPAYLTGDNQSPGDGVSGIYLWGAQLETGSVATSYIPTTTAQVTRAADTSTSAQVTRAADYNSCNTQNIASVDGGVIAVRTGGFISPNWAALVQIDDGQSNAARILLDGSNGNKQPRLFVNQNTTAGVVVSEDVTLASLGAAAFAGRYGKASNAISYNGRTAFAQGSVTLSGNKAPTRLTIGCIGMSYQLNGYIKQLTYFPRQLSDADLQALTILED